MKIYTRNGDTGMTRLLSGEHIAKDSLRVEAYGSVDEADAALGMARALCVKPEVKAIIYDVQKLLSGVMAELASTTAQQYIDAEQVIVMEQAIDKFEAQLPPLREFLIPGDTPGAAALDMARTVSRRAERAIVRLSRQARIHEQLLVVMNRLSDLCFVLSRIEQQQTEQY